MRDPKAVAGIIGGAFGLVVIAALVVLVFAPTPSPVPPPPGWPRLSPTWAPPGRPRGPAAEPGAGIQTRVDADWAERTAAATGIPVRALVAYAGAALFKAEQLPECAISWSTLAAVGRVESDHGRHGRSSLDDAGTGHVRRSSGSRSTA